MALALDGTPQGANSGSSSALALPAFTTSNANDIVYIGVMTNGGPVTSITGGGLTWINRIQYASGGAGEYNELWYAKAASPLAGVVFTVNTTSAAYITVGVLAFSGANYATPFDPNGAIPFSDDATGVANVTTSNANDAIVAMARGIGATTTIDAPYTATHTANFMGMGYRIVSAAQAASSLTWNTGSGLHVVVDAIMEATGGPSPAVLLHADVVDLGLSEIVTDATTVFLCSAMPADYAQASGASGGIKLASGTITFNAPAASAAGDGRRITSNAVSGGSVTATGSATHWAVCDASRLLAKGELSAPEAMTSGETFSLTAIPIVLPAR